MPTPASRLEPDLGDLPSGGTRHRLAFAPRRSNTLGVLSYRPAHLGIRGAEDRSELKLLPRRIHPSRDPARTEPRISERQGLDREVGSQREREPRLVRVPARVFGPEREQPRTRLGAAEGAAIVSSRSAARTSLESSRSVQASRSRRRSVLATHSDPARVAVRLEWCSPEFGEPRIMSRQPRTPLTSLAFPRKLLVPGGCVG